jgi:hypothetical protein
MIHYALRCAGGHDFDGWFPGSDGFEAQRAAGQVACPRCGSVVVDRALMAPAVARNVASVAPAHPPAEMMAVLQRLRAAVERDCAYVGPDFAEQALLMHQGELVTRGIYGEASASDAAQLRDEGVMIGVVPWVPLADS